MATDFGTDVAALTDLPDPEALISGVSNVGYAVARRWLTQGGALAEIGDTVPYTCFDIRDYLGARVTTSTVSEIQNLCVASASEDPRVLAIVVTVTIGGGKIVVSATVTTSSGPFDFVLSVGDVSALSMLGG